MKLTLALFEREDQDLFVPVASIYDGNQVSIHIVGKGFPEIRNNWMQMTNIFLADRPV